MRDAKAARRVLKVLVDAAEPVYGLDIARRAKMGSGTLYPTLGRLTCEGWIEGIWEQLDPSEASRPRRRYYRITAEGEAALKALGG